MKRGNLKSLQGGGQLEAVVLEAIQERCLTLATNPTILRKNPLIY